MNTGEASAPATADVAIAAELPAPASCVCSVRTRATLRRSVSITAKTGRRSLSCALVASGGRIQENGDG